MPNPITSLDSGQQLVSGEQLTATPQGGSGGFAPNATLFNGATIGRSSALNGVAASTTLIFSMWVKLNVTPTGNWFIYLEDSSSTVQFRVGVIAGTGWLFQMVSSGAYWFPATTTVPGYNQWYHLLVCVDSANSANCHFFVNDVDQGVAGGDSSGSFAWNTYPNWTVPLDISTSFSLSEVYIAPGQFLDFSVSSNRAKFAIAGAPVSLGATGSLPTGTPPAVYLSNPYGTFQDDNSGNGNNFSVTTGSLANDPSVP